MLNIMQIYIIYNRPSAAFLKKTDRLVSDKNLCLFINFVANIEY